MDNLNLLIVPYLTSILDDLIYDLKDVISLKKDLTKEEKNSFLSTLDEVILIIDDNMLLNPKINGKITVIKDLINNIDNIYESK
jgi:hypothetical protein